MGRKCFVLIGLIVMSNLLAGCAVYRTEKDYGNSFRLAKLNQTLNPEAEKNLNPVYGFDGQTAQKVIGAYRKDFETRYAPPRFPLGVTLGQTMQQY